MENEKDTNVKTDDKEELVSVDDATGIKISEDVVAVIAGVAASEVPGVCSMSGGLGLTEVFGKKNMAKGIKAEVNIIVEYGVRIPDIAFEIQNRVKTAVESMTGLKVQEVNIHVQGVNVISKEKAPEEKDVDIID